MTGSNHARQRTENLAATCAHTARTIEADLAATGDPEAMRLLMLAAYVNQVTAHVLAGGEISAAEIHRTEDAVAQVSQHSLVVAGRHRSHSRHQQHLALVPLDVHAHADPHLAPPQLSTMS